MFAPLWSNVSYVAEVVGLPEASRRHDDVRLHATRTSHLLWPVEVHDRDDDRPELGGAPERDGRLDPVRQLEYDDVAGPDAAGPQGGGEGPGRLVDLAERAAPWPLLRAHDELGIGQLSDCAGHGDAQRLVGPPAPGEVALHQVGRDGPEVPAPVAGQVFRFHHPPDLIISGDWCRGPLSRSDLDRHSNWF